MDFFFESNAPLDLGKDTQKFYQNMEVIRILKACEAENRPATAAEQSALSLYVGWGAASLLNKLVDNQTAISKHEFDMAKASSLNAHYTALPVIGAIWDAVTHLGIGGSEMSILDPSAGVGHFKSAAPQSLRNAAWAEIELDTLTASILKLLHPTSRVYAQGYEETHLPENKFDLVISNVPFGNYGVGSSTQKLPRFVKASIHDFFFANSIALLRPGGIMAFITSRFTLDKKETTMRKWLAERMDLLAAVRLPCTAFKANAGTEVVTDIIFLQKRSEPRPADAPHPAWLKSKRVILHSKYGYGEYPVNISRYYIDHPQMVLGRQTCSGTMYRKDNYTVSPFDDTDLGEAIRTALTGALPEGAARRSVEAAPMVETAPDEQSPPAIITTASVRYEKDQTRLDLLHGIYRTAKNLLAAEIRGDKADELQERLNTQYDSFVLLYGLVNNRANMRLLKGSVEGPFLQALEIYESASSTARKAGIFNNTLVRKIITVDEPTPADALLVCLDRKGYADIEYIAILSNVAVVEVIEQLGDRIYQLPSGGWEVADAYLSGNVREKLNTAKAAAEFDPAFQRNVAALDDVLPAAIPSDQIRAPLGAGWIPADVIVSFLEHLLTNVTDYSASYVAKVAYWEINADHSWRIASALRDGKWGTPRMDTLELMRLGLNAKMPVVYDTWDGDRVVNQTETVAAQSKLADIKTEFERWLWSDSERAERLAEIYNQQYNAHRVRQYDGSHLTTPGLNKGIELRPGQLNAVWRILQSPTTLLWHDVGYGKTLSGIVSAMEAKRLGLIHKAMVVVPNHLVGQWQAIALNAYPNANVLVATPKDMRKGSRGEFMSRIAMNDWDLVIVPFSSFKLLPVRPETQRRFFQAEIDRLEEYLYELKADAGNNPASAGVIKEIEKAKKRFQAKLDDLSSMDKDSSRTITWEELGIGLLIVDEFHAYKNLYYATKMTRIAGLPRSTSQRAFDMFIKTRWTLEHGGKFVGLTGTPITNTIAEMFTMQRYFQMAALEDLGLSHFDAWANQFALAEPGLEMTPDGAGFRMNTRFRSFVNIPELLQLFFQVCDRQRIDKQSGIERPDLYGPVKIVVSGGQELKDYTQSLAERAERIRRGHVEPHIDNMLKITTDGRKAALDLSLVIPAPHGAPMAKIDTLCTNIAQVYCDSAPVDGAQLVFCDLATPKPKRKQTIK